MLTYRKARQLDTEEERIHAVPVVAPDQTVCGLGVSSVEVIDEDWEFGSFRVKCTDCIGWAVRVPANGSARAAG